MDGELLTKIFGGAISALVLMLLGPRIVRWVYPSNKKEVTQMPKLKPDTNKIITDDKSLSDQKKVLLELKKENILTEFEYNEKLKILEVREYELSMKQQEETLLKEKRQKKELLTKKLEELLKSGIISQKEFEEKKLLIDLGPESKQLEELPPVIKEVKFIKNGFTIRMGLNRQYKIRFDNGRSIVIFQKKSNNKYYIYGTIEILLFPDLDTCQEYIVKNIL